MINSPVPTDFSWSGHWCAKFSSLNKASPALAWRCYQTKIRSKVNFLSRVAIPSQMTCPKMEAQNTIFCRKPVGEDIFGNLQGLLNKMRGICVSVWMSGKQIIINSALPQFWGAALKSLSMGSCRELLQVLQPSLTSWVPGQSPSAAFPSALHTRALSAGQQSWLWRDTQPFQEHLLKRNDCTLYLTVK